MKTFVEKVVNTEVEHFKESLQNEEDAKRASGQPKPPISHRHIPTLNTFFDLNFEGHEGYLSATIEPLHTAGKQRFVDALNHLTHTAAQSFSHPHHLLTVDAVFHTENMEVEEQEEPVALHKVRIPNYHVEMLTSILDDRKTLQSPRMAGQRAERRVAADVEMLSDVAAELDALHIIGPNKWASVLRDVSQQEAQAGRG